MELIQLRYFLSVAETLSFTEASKRMFVTQPTISKQIALLEKELGLPLFTRNHRMVTLTAGGELLYKDLQPLVKQLDIAIEKVRLMQDKLPDAIKIGFCGMMDVHRLMPNFFQAFSVSYPNIQLQISSLTYRQMTLMLEKGQLDLSFTYSLGPRQSSYEYLPISRSSAYLYYSTDLPVAEKENLSVEDFIDVPMIRLEHENDREADYFDQIEQCYHMRPQKIIRVPDMETLSLYTESGLGFCIIGRSYHISNSNNIRSIDLSGYHESVGTDAVWRKDNSNTSLQILIQQIKRYMNDHPIVSANK